MTTDETKRTNWMNRMDLSRKELLALADEVDPGIQRAVVLLNMFNIETCQSCEGKADVDGDNPNIFLNTSKHCYPEPTVDFKGGTMDGLKALTMLHEHGVTVFQLRRQWDVIDGEVTGPIWSITFVRRLKPMSHEEITELLDWYEK